MMIIRFYSLYSNNVPVENGANIGDPEKVFAKVDYNIYSIRVTVDSGIGSVAVNGTVLENGSGNVYTISGLKADVYKVSYVLKPNYEGTPELTVNGDTQTSLQFTISGTDVLEYKVSLVGTSPVSNTVVIDNGDKDDGMSLTDILLIILVVLIAVMAIMVALRLMRS